MEHIYHIGKFPVCAPYGEMEILFDCLAAKCFVMCDECSIEFQSVDDYKNKTNGKRIFYKKQHYDEICERIGISYKNLKQMEVSDA